MTPDISQVIRDALDTNIKTLIERLTPVWESIGVDEEEIRNRMNDILLHSIQSDFEAFAVAQEEDRDTHIEAIQANCSEIRQIYTQLAEPLIDLSYTEEESTVTLSAQLERSESDVKNTLIKQATRLEELQAVGESLGQTLEDLGHPADPLLADTENLSAERLRLMEEAYAKANATRTELSERAVNLAGEITTLAKLVGQTDLMAISGGAAEAAAIEAVLLESRFVELKPRQLPTLESIKENLVQIRTERQAQVDDLYASIERLSGILQEPVPSKPSQLTTVDVDTLINIRDDMERQKMSKLEELCTKHRAVIDDLMEKLGDNVAGIDVPEDEPSEETLDALKTAEATMETRLAATEPIVELCLKREKILSDKAEFEIQSKDPSRLMKRDPGRLLREEKFRNTVKKDLPRISKKIMALIKGYEAEHGAFLRNGGEYKNEVVDQINGTNKRVSLVERTAPVRPASSETAELVKTLPRKGDASSKIGKAKPSGIKRPGSSRPRTAGTAKRSREM